MIFAEKEYRTALKNIVDALKVIAGDDNTASVQINSDGHCTLRVGASRDGEGFSVESFAKVLDEEMTRHIAMAKRNDRA